MAATRPASPRHRSTPQITIRARTPDDAAGVAALHSLPGYRFGTLRLPHETVDNVRKRIEQTPADAVTLVAVLEDRIVGDIGLTPMAGRRRHSGELGMGVHDGHVGQGIGRAMLAEALAIADDWLDLKRVQLTVYPDNEPALALYRRFGFEEEGRLRMFAFRAGAHVDALVMARLRP
ncbi:GNAT family N-acetyltransferase [Rhizobium halophytocola]|uniref:Acetyltransferase n=1 Tax=Rhizobium halophytocola TaxID=735519 RepID=A0ABS4E2Z8_9HYPH|nr:putative acetyltransferase [Rhizobium halophytocola]